MNFDPAQFTIFTEFVSKITPILVFFILLEISVNIFKKAKNYSLKESFINLTCISFEQFTDFFMWLFLIPVYIYLSKYSFFKLESTDIENWVLLLIIIDFCFYWWHRLSHQLPLFWSIHHVHHQGKEFNLLLGLRNSAFNRSYSMLFYWPIPLLGFPIEMALIAFVLHASYQFFLHTEFAPKFSFIDYLFVTPTLHKVHHGKNREYINKNFGGILTVWDRLFKTFQSENKAVTLGVKDNYQTANPILLNIFPFFKKVMRSKKKEFGSKKIHIYTLIQALLFFVMAIIYNENSREASILAKSFFWFFATFNLFILGMVFDNHRLKYFFESLRLSSFIAFILFFVK